MFWERLFSLDHCRRKALRSAPPGPLHDYLAVPFPGARSNCHELEFLALDLETTGLDSEHDEIVSVGWVCLRGLSIDLASARHELVSVSRQMPEQSAIIHKITDDAAAAGSPLRQVLSELLAQLAGKVLIAHHASVELGFLGRACEQLFGGRFLCPVIDTEWLARRWLERRNKSYRAGELRLANLRTRYNLPRYRAHDALSDALAAAELFVAQVAELGPAQRLPLKQLAHRI